MRLRAAAALLAALCASACAAPLIKLPQGPGTLSSDGAAALTQALKSCRSISTISAELAVSGQTGGRRTSGRLAIGMATPALVYIEAPAPFGAPAFVFAAVDDSATLLLPRDRRVLEHGDPAAVLEALTGVRLAPADLRAALTGCGDPGGRDARALGESWRVVGGQDELYLGRSRASDPWRLVAVVHHAQPGVPAWRAEYRDFLNDLPRTVRLISDDPHIFDLRVALSQIDVNVALPAETFQIRIPSGTEPMTIEDLRRSGPLAAPGGR